MEESQKAKLVFPLFFSVALASRLPLLGGGFGSDGDAWRNAVAALSMRELGHYVASRPPGFPVFETLLVPLVPAGWVATNALAAIAGVVASIVFFRIARTLETRSSFWLTFAFAFSPVLWVHTTQTMDYAVGLGLLLGSYLALLDRRYLLGGLLLALASGCRFTTGALVVPAVAMMMVRRDGRRNIFVFLACFAVVTAVEYIPAALVFRSQESVQGVFWHVSRAHVTFSGLSATLRLDAVFLFGKVGSIILVLSLAGKVLTEVFRGVRVRGRFVPVAGKPAIVYETGVVFVVALLYMLVPYEVEYLIPLFPFALLLVGRLLSRSLLIVVAVLVVSEAMVTPLFDQRRFAAGRLFTEIDERRADLTATRALEQERPSEPTVFVVGKPGVLRLFVMAPSLERTQVVWPRVLEPGVALWSPDRRLGYAAFLDQATRSKLEGEGYRIEEARLDPPRP